MRQREKNHHVAQRTEQKIATINRIVEFLGEHIRVLPAARDLATMAGLSRSHFSRTFHAQVGVSLRHYVIQRRVQQACELLKHSSLSATAISRECGFYDLPHMNKAFRRRLGVSPYRFRQASEAQEYSATRPTGIRAPDVAPRAIRVTAGRGRPKRY
jgi:AraC-like DNA-binding protein